MTRPLIDLVEDSLPNGVDAFHVAGKDPGYYYCWLNAKQENLQRARDVWGYEILGPQHSEAALTMPTALGERKIGDVVLARMPRERYEKILRLKERAAEAQITAATEQWKDAAQKAGFPVNEELRVEDRPEM